MTTEKESSSCSILLTALAGGALIKDAAKVAGIGERTAHRRLEDPDFQARITELRSEFLSVALKIIESKEHYDLLLVDNELPNVSGLELIRRARQLPHRKDTPIVMLSASNIEAEARQAGASAFLRKPEEINKLVEVVTRLLSQTN